MKTVNVMTVDNIKLVIKTGWYLHKDRQNDQWDRVYIPEIDSHICDQFLFNKGARTIHTERIVFSANGA